MPGTRLFDSGDIARMCELKGGQAAVSHLSEALEKKHLRPEDFSIRELAESFLGAEWVNSLAPKRGRHVPVALLEAAGPFGVRYSDFSNITGQIVFSKFLEGYTDQEFVFSNAVEKVPTDIQDMEKIPGITNVGDESEIVPEGDPYPYAGVSEDYIEVAAKRKRGVIVGVTREAIFGDKTGMILQRARKLGFYQGLNLEKRVIDAVIDENAGAVSATMGGHRYHWRGTSYATFQTTSPWDNVTTSNALVDWTDVEAAQLTMLAMTDPYTGEPISITPKHLIVTPQLLYTARRILTATRVSSHVGGYATTGNLTEFESANPVSGGGLTVLSSQLLATRAATDTDWWIGDVREAVNRFVNWDIETEEAAPNHPDRFLRDIEMQFKVSVKDVVSVVQPRALHESRA
jgi:hypothetical protein